MNILENDIEDLIFQTWMEDQGVTLAGMGLYGLQYGAMLRQVDLGVIGTADLVHICMDGPATPRRYVNITIIELKRDKLNYDALGQVCRYVRNAQRLLHERYGDRTTVNVTGMLIGNRVNTSGDFVYVTDSASDIEVVTYSLSARTGLSFEYHDGWYKTNSTVANTDKIAPTVAKLFKHYLEGYNV